MAKVIPVGPIDPVLYGFAKKQAEKAERDPRYVPKKLETPAHSITYRRVGAIVKAFVIDKIAPVVMPIGSTNALPIMPKLPAEAIPAETYEWETTKVEASPLARRYASRHTHAAKEFSGNAASYALRANFSYISMVFVRSKVRGFVDGGYTYTINTQWPSDRFATLLIHDAHDYELGYVSIEDPADYSEPMPIIKYRLDYSVPDGGGAIPNGVYELNDFPEYHVGKYTAGERYTDKDGNTQVVTEKNYSTSYGLAATPVSISEKVRDAQYEIVIKSNYVKSASLEIDTHVAVATIDKESFLAKSADEIRPPVVLSGDAFGLRARISQEYHYDPRELGYFGRLDHDVMAAQGAGCEGMWHVQTLMLSTNLNQSSAPINRNLNKTIPGGYAWDMNAPLVPTSEPCKSFARVTVPDNKHFDLVSVAIDSLGDVYHLVFVFVGEIPDRTWEYGKYIGEPNIELRARIWHKFGGGARYELHKNGTFLRVVKELTREDLFGGEGDTAIDWHKIDSYNDFSQAIRTFYVNTHDVVEHIYPSADKQGGCAVVFSKARLETHYSGVSERVGHCVLTDDGLFFLYIGSGWEPPVLTDRYVMFLPMQRPPDGVQALDVDAETTIYKLRPHKKYEMKPTKADPYSTRRDYAKLFVSEKNDGGKPRRCYVAFDDGMCVDLTDFADVLKANPGATAEDWKDKPFGYAPVETTGNYETVHRINRAYVPQWVRAYYDYEDQP